MFLPSQPVYVCLQKERKKTTDTNVKCIFLCHLVGVGRNYCSNAACAGAFTANPVNT